MSEIVAPSRTVEEGTELDATVTQRDVTLLQLISWGCGCESYYGYHCDLCKAVGSLPPERFARLVEMGLAYHGDYSPYHLTAEGREAIQRAGRSI